MVFHVREYRMERLPPKPCKGCLVRRLALCQPLTMEQLESVRSSYLSLGSGMHLYRQGDFIRETYTLCTGWLALYRTLEEGKRQITRFILPGDMMGTRLGAHHPSNHSAQALTECELCLFSNLEDAAKAYPELGFHLASLYPRHRVGE